MYKDYLEDKHESKIIFDDSSIQTIKRIFSNHDTLYVEFPQYEIPISSSSINKIFSLSQTSKEENILFSLRIPEYNSLTKSYSELLDSMNNSTIKKQIDKSKNNTEQSQNDTEENKIENEINTDNKIENEKQNLRNVRFRPGSMKFPNYIKNQLKRKIKKEEYGFFYPSKEGEAQSEDEGERSNIIHKISPPILSTDKITNTSINLPPKFFGCIGENYDFVIHLWIFFYVSLGLISLFLICYKGYYFYLSTFNFIFFIFLFFDLYNVFIGIFGINHLNTFIKLNQEDSVNYTKILNIFVIFDILGMSLFLIYCFYFQVNAFNGNIYMVNNLYKYLNLFSLFFQIGCLYVNLQMEKFYIENNNLLPLRESLL